MSKNQADKAGKRLRHFAVGRESLELEAWVEAFEAVSEWRGLHQSALTKTVVGLRSAVATSCQLRPHGRVVSRLKTEDKILDKLCRESTRLSSIYDIGGCRAILPTQEDVDRTLKQLQTRARKLTIDRVRDYVREEQHPTHYKAVHVLGQRDGYRVEIQLRTEEQHDWAMRVERYDAQTGEDAKHGAADPEALEILGKLARGI